MGLERIKDIRKSKGMTIEELSEKSGVPVSTIKKISAGITQNPNLETVRAIARALNCTLDDFDDPIAIDEIKTSPKPAATDPEDEKEKDEIVKVLTEGLSRLGFLDKDGMISDRDFKFLCSLVDLMFAHFDQED